MVSGLTCIGVVGIQDPVRPEVCLCLLVCLFVCVCVCMCVCVCACACMHAKFLRHSFFADVLIISAEHFSLVRVQCILISPFHKTFVVYQRFKLYIVQSFGGANRFADYFPSALAQGSE